MTKPCSEPLSLDDLVQYRLGELNEEAERSVEEHYFDCASCAERLRWVESLGAALSREVLTGNIAGVVTRAFVEVAKAKAVRIREYEIPAGGSVNCTAAPDDDLIVVCFAVADRATEVVITSRMDVEGVPSVALPSVDAVVDTTARQVVCIYPAAVVRTYSKARFTFQIQPKRSESQGQAKVSEDEPKTYVMNHTPWEELHA